MYLGDLRFSSVVPKSNLEEKKKKLERHGEKERALQEQGERMQALENFLALTCGNANSASFPKGGSRQDHKE